MRVGLYARVSTKDKGQDPEIQLRELRAYCRARGYEVYKEYVDHGWSGMAESRPALDELLKDARRRKIDMILVWAFDRFARSVKQLVLSLDEFKALGISFRSHTQDIDTSGPFGMAIFAVIAAMAQLERDLLRERVMAIFAVIAAMAQLERDLLRERVIVGLEKARRNGKRLGRPKLVVDKFRIAALRAEGETWPDIARTLGIARATAIRLFRESQKPATDTLQ